MSTVAEGNSDKKQSPADQNVTSVAITVNGLNPYLKMTYEEFSKEIEAALALRGKEVNELVMYLSPVDILRVTGKGNEEQATKEVKKVLGSVVFLGVAMMLTSSAYFGLESLQTTVNNRMKLGFSSLLFVYGTRTLTSAFVPSLPLERLRPKEVFFLLTLCFTPFVGFQMIFNIYTSIIGGILLGIASGILPALIDDYVTRVSRIYCNIVSISFIDVKYQIHHMLDLLLWLAPVCGNMVSSLVFHFGSNETEKNTTTCIADFSLWNEDSFTWEPTYQQILYLSNIQMVFLVSALLIIVLGVPNLKRSSEYGTKYQQSMLPNELQQLFLVPVFVADGMGKAFLVAIFTYSFISCKAGIFNIGFIMSAHGIAVLLASFSAGLCRKCDIIKFIIVTVASLLEILVLLDLLYWDSSKENLASLYLVVIAWGICSSKVEIARDLYEKNNRGGSVFWKSLGSVVLASCFQLSTTNLLFVLLGLIVLGNIGGLLSTIRIRRPKATFCIT